MKGKIEIDSTGRSVNEWYELLIQRMEDEWERRGEIFRKKESFEY